MSKKSHEKQLARAREKRAAERQQGRRRSRVVWAVVGGVVVVVGLVFGSRLLGGLVDDDEPAAEPTATATATPATETDAAAAAPCPAPVDAPTPDTSLQFDAAPPAEDAPAAATATIATTCGDIVVELDPANAPQTVANFLFLAEQGYYDGTPFHRVMDNFVIQGGDPTGTGTGGPGYSFPDELDHVAEQFEEVEGPCSQDPDEPCYAYPRGTLAMANAGPDTNGSQFFVVQADPSNTWPAAYTPFGTVVEGMDVVDDIAAGPTGGPNGDQAVDPAVVTSIDVETGS